MFICHRINTSKELLKIPKQYGIEIDIRDSNQKLFVTHDPFTEGEELDVFLEHFDHAWIILNVKSERIEYKILEILKQRKIDNYFFLDCSFPMIIDLHKNGIKNIAIRYSEFESIESVLLVKDKVSWIWVDCFTKLPLDKDIYNIFKNANLKICIVSPELQKHSINMITDFKKQLEGDNIEVDAICTKSYNIQYWL